MKNITINITVLLAFLIYSCGSSAQSEENQIAEDLSPQTFREKIKTLENGQVLDVRTPEEWADVGTIADAHKIDFFSENFDQQVSQLDKTKPVMVYCAAGGRSAKAMEKMKALGFTEVYNLSGGMGAWKEAGYVHQHCGVLNWPYSVITF